MLLPIAAVVFLAYLLLRPALSRPASRRLRLPAWRKAVTDKAISIAMVAAALAVLIHGNVWAASCLFGLSLWMLGRSGGFEARSAAVSIQRSTTVEMALDRASGRRSARMIAGPHAGAVLDTLGLDGCLALLTSCRATDPVGARLLEAYLDGRSSGWRTAGDADRDAGARRARASGGMTEEQAYEVLGLGRGAPRDAVVRAHRTLMKRWHPDQGGTAELAARANEAKEVLLRRHG